MAKTIVLKRVSSIPEGTFGVLLEDKIPFCLTLERPDKNNQPNESCIPVGSYLCRKIISPSKGEVFQVDGVPNRSHILIHKGNLVEHSLGCILVGEQFERLGDKLAILASDSAFRELMTKLKNDTSFNLIIQDVSA